MTVPEEEAPANYVPAAAVIRRVRALTELPGVSARVAAQVECESPGLNLGIALSETTWL